MLIKSPLLTGDRIVYTMSLSKQMHARQVSSAGGGASHDLVQWGRVTDDDRRKKRLRLGISKNAFQRSALNAVEYGKGGSTILWEEEKIQLKWDWDQMNRGENEGVVKITVKSVSLSLHPPTDPCKCLLYS